MTLGEKIKNYRLLKGLTQKELGMRVGFSEATADSRIRKYEKDIMAPKADLRMKIANALDVSITALSDNDISSSEDVLQAFFQLEDIYRVKINKGDNKLCLEFSLENTKNDLLNSYLNVWADHKAIAEINNTNFAYRNWKAQFPGSLIEDWNTIRNSIFEKYNNAITDSYYQERAAVTQRDFIHHLHEMLRNNITMDIQRIQDSDFGPDPRTDYGLRFEFSCEELLASTSQEYINAFAVFLKDTYVINQLGHVIDYRVYQYKEGHQFVVKVRHPALERIEAIYNNNLKKYIEAERNKSDISKDLCDELIEIESRFYNIRLDSSEK